VPSVGIGAPEFDRWNQEAQGILSDVRQTLRTFDSFQAFRASTASDSNARLPNELAWDPPTGAAWDEATHVTRGLHGRADQLFQAVTTASVDPGLWREQRQLADATRDLLDLGDVLGAYRDRLDVLPPGDASSALGLLDRAWAQWDATAARWGISRSEPMPCDAVSPSQARQRIRGTTARA
jgi:hypothetical protein